MRKNRRLLQVTTSDDEDDGDSKPLSSNRAGRTSSRSSADGPVHDDGGGGGGGKRRKTVRMPDYDDEDNEENDHGGGERDGEGAENKLKRRRKKEDEDEDEEEEEDEEGEEEEEEDEEDEEEEEEEKEEDEEAKPVGEPIRISAKGRWKRSHYVAFELDGNQYELEDPVLLVPEEKNQKPYVAIIKDISQTKTGGLMVTGQWFYRPEEAEKKGGGNWQSQDTRELFYSFHRDEVPAESVMHKCVVHFIPRHKQLPRRKEHPGFIVQKVYDTVEKKLWQLTDKDYEDTKQHEIDLLVQKTMAQLGDVPDLETEEGNSNVASEQQDQLKGKKSFKKRNVSPIEVIRRDEDTMSRSDQNVKAETPGNYVNTKYTAIVAELNEGTGDTHRDKWLERLLQAVEYIFNTERTKDEVDNKTSENDQLTEEKKSNVFCVGEKTFVWPDSAISSVVALENASHETFASDFQKYNQKMRQLSFNLKHNAFLARRFVTGELDAVKILSMSPTELKEGLTAEETAQNEPEESASMQMTDARCSRCSEFKVGVRDIIQAGHGDRYQLECIACGHSWYASRDAISMLTIEWPNSTKSVGTAPWATTKFENVEKQLSSPRDATKPVDDVMKKSTEAYMPVMERQKSLGKPRVEETAESGQ